MRNHGPILFRAALYFIAAFLGPLLEKIVGVLEKDQWPSPQRWALGCGVGLFAGVLILRSFYDGSAQRNADENAARNGNGNAHKAVEITVDAVKPTAQSPGT